MFYTGYGYSKFLNLVPLNSRIELKKTPLKNEYVYIYI